MIWFDDAPRRRTLSQKDKEHLWRNAGEKCENPRCRTPLKFPEMQVGHKTAYSKGGATTLKNSACLCWPCNKLQGTDSWAVFLKKQNVVEPKKAATESVKTRLQGLSIAQLKALATKHNVKVTGSSVDDWFETRRVAPTKSQYVAKLSNTLTIADLKSIPKAAPKKASTSKPRKKKESGWSLW